MDRDKLIQYLRAEFLRGPMGHRADALADFIEKNDEERDADHATWKETRVDELKAQIDVLNEELDELE